MVGDGNLINIWTDPWVPYIDGFKVWPVDLNVELPVMVYELIDQSTRSWNQIMLNIFFNEEARKAILQIDIPLVEERDQLC